VRLSPDVRRTGDAGLAFARIYVRDEGDSDDTHRLDLFQAADAMFIAKTASIRVPSRHHDGFAFLPLVKYMMGD
jgi:hypothetical protein